jgi:peptidyl-prolyl cis-trans isomerase C
VKRFAIGPALAGMAALMLLAGCGKTPKGQVLAIVNGEDITVQQLEAELVDIPIPDSVNRKQLTRTLLEGLIDRQLQVEEARRLKLDTTPEFRSLLKRNEENLLAGLLGKKLGEGVPMPADEDIRNYIANNPLQFARRQRITLDQLSFTPPKDQRKLAPLAQAHSLEAAAAMLRSMGIAATRSQGSLDTGQTAPDVAAQIDRAPPGEPILLPQGDRLAIGVVTAREPIVLTPSQSRLAAARAVRGLDLLHESEAQVAAARTKAEIQYEPGWEPAKAGATR